MTDKKFYIRFGLHRDRNMLRLLKEDYAGIVLPAHILAYSPNATIAAIRYIDQPYFIDPMTYIYADGFLDDYKVYKKEDDLNHLKPSIMKLTKDLALEDFFPETTAESLTIAEFTDELIERIAQGNLNLQLNRVNDGLLSSTKKLDELLSEIGMPPSVSNDSYPPPQFITTPYFLIPRENTKEWLDINLKLARKTKELAPSDHEIRPIVLTYVDLLDASILDAYSEFDHIITWVEDLDEAKSTVSDEQVRKLKVYKDFIKQSTEKEKKVINLYGSYYSALLMKLGLEAFCNGPLYGEYKSSSASLGGIPPVRVYMPSLHRFYIYSQANELLRLHPELYDHFPARSKELFRSIPELAKILRDVTLAQEHFINSRNQEISSVKSFDLKTLTDNLSDAFSSVGPFEDKPLKHKEPKQLVAWSKALEDEMHLESQQALPTGLTA